MKKRLFTLSMVSLLALGLTSCNNIKKSTTEDGKEIIVTINVDGKDVNYTADDLLNQYASTETGVKAYYNAIYDVLVRKTQEMTTTMTIDAEAEVDKFVNNCKSSAATNGTTYKTELSKALEAEGVDDLGELRELKELEIQKAEYENQFYSDEKLKEYTTNFIEEKVPYHIRHILVKTDDVEGSSVYNKEISKDESKKIYSVVSRLASGTESFGDIAYDASDDTSNALYGSVGIMQSDTSFVSEFKFGIYYYDAMLSGDNDTGKTSEEVLEMLNIPSQVSLGEDFTLNTKEILDSSVYTVPYSVVEMFNTYADSTKTVNNYTYTDEIVPGSVRHEITSSYYPRNVLFNTYFNNHGLTFITDEGLSNTQNNPNWVEPNETLKAVLPEGFDGKILTDNGNPILVTYNPTTGLHFMIIEKSPINQKYTSYVDYKTGEIVQLNSLEEELAHYYSLDVPSSNSNVENDNRYITYIKSNRTEYGSRATELKNNIKSFDPHMDYLVFESLLYGEDGNVRSDVTIDETILALIEDYINDQRANTELTNKTSNIATWASYLQLLNYQEVQKEAKQLDFSETKQYFTDTKDL